MNNYIRLLSFSLFFLLFLTIFFPFSLVDAIGVPVVSTYDAIGVTNVNATFRGVINNDNGAKITSYGFEYGFTSSYGNRVEFSAPFTPYTPLVFKQQSASYGGTINSIIVDDTYIYVGGSITFKVFQYWKSNMTKKAETSSYGGIIRSIAVDDTYVYAAGESSYKVFQYWKSNMTKKAETNSYGGPVNSITVDDTYIYVGGSLINKVFQYWKSNMTKKAETSSYGEAIYSITVDNTYVYVGGVTINKVFQYWKSNMTKKAETSSYGGVIRSIAVDDTYVYAGGGVTYKVFQYWKSNMTKKAETSNYGGTIYSIAVDDTYVYAGGASQYKVNKYIIDYDKLETPYSFSYNVSLQPGCLYHYRAYANNSQGTGYGSDSVLLTKPYPPSASSASVSGNNINVQWTSFTAGSGVTCRTVVRYKTTGYPSSVTDGTLLANTTSNSVVLTNYDVDKIYYFGLWTYISASGYSWYSETYTTASAKTLKNPTNLQITAKTNNSISLSWTKGSNTTVVRRGTTDPISPTQGIIVYNGTAQTVTDTGLLPSKRYYYRAWNWNGSAYVPLYNTSISGYTLPNIPSNVQVITGGNIWINITWNFHNSFNRIVIRRSATSQPILPTDGVSVYNGTGLYFNQTITHPYYYTVFGFNTTTGYYSEGVPALAYFICFNAYDTITETNITDYNIFVSNYSGTQTFNSRNCDNPTFININNIPKGSIFIKINKTGYRDSIFFIDLYINNNYNFNVYLTPISIEYESLTYKPGCSLRSYTDSVTVSNPSVNCIIPCSHLIYDIVSVELYNKSLYGSYGGWIQVANNKYSYNSTHVVIDKSVLSSNILMARVTYYYYSCIRQSNLYSIRVVEVVYTQLTEYTVGVYNAKVLFKKYINNTGSYENISCLLTDSNGYCYIYLLENDFYMINITKNGYNSLQSIFITPVPDLYGRLPEIVYKINKTEPTYNFSFIPPYISVTRNNTVIQIRFIDNYRLTNNLSIYLYQNNTIIYNTIFNNPYNLTFNITDINQYEYVIKIIYYHDQLRYQTFIFILNASIYRFNQTDISNRLKNIFGESSLFLWQNLIMFLFFTIVLFNIDKKDAGKWIIFIGVIFCFVSMIGLVDIERRMIVPIIVVMLGVLLEWVNARRNI